jgi:hypothetical protein
MPFSLHVEHEVIDGETVLEKFDGIESFNDPPMTNSLHLKFADENRDEETLKYGNVVRAIDNNE